MGTLLVDAAYGDGIGRLTLNRPSVLNAIDELTCDELSEGLGQLEAAGCRVVVVDGVGRAFSAGVDITHVRTLRGQALDRFIEKTWRSFDCIARSPMVSLAVMHGYALGGGLELALACDLRVVESDCMTGLPEMGLGTLPGSGAMQRLPPLIGPSRTLELVVSGRRLRGEEAHRLGIATRLAPTDAGLETARAWACEIASRGRHPLRLAKAAMRIGGLEAAAFHGAAGVLCREDGEYAEKTAIYDEALRQP